MNFLIGISAPTTDILDDEISFLDTLWRVVSGQRTGIDYHNPLGFGPYELGALLWHEFGPHDYVMRLAITLFSLAIAVACCIVVQRTIPRRTGLALLFCVTVAFQLSAPTALGVGTTSVTMALFYNRLITSALAVLFLHTFGRNKLSFGNGRVLPQDKVIDIALAAFLLNLLFLIKISGFLLGVMILLAGCMQSHATRRFLNLCSALLLFIGVTAIEFKVWGLS